MIEHISYWRKFLWKASAWRHDDIHTVEHKMEWKEPKPIVYKVGNKEYNSPLCPVLYTKTRSIMPIKISSGISKYWLVMSLPLITKLILLREKQLSTFCYYVLSGRWLQMCALQSDWLCTKHSKLEIFPVLGFHKTTTQSCCDGSVGKSLDKLSSTLRAHSGQKELTPNGTLTSTNTLWYLHTHAHSHIHTYHRHHHHHPKLK